MYMLKFLHNGAGEGVGVKPTFGYMSIKLNIHSQITKRGLVN